MKPKTESYSPTTWDTCGGSTVDSVASHGLAGSLQFVINNEPHLPKSREHKKLVRSHVMRTSQAIRKKKNSMPIQKRRILQKLPPQWPARSDFEANTNSTTTNTSHPRSTTEQKQSTVEKVDAALSVGSESDICLTPESSYLASDEGEAPSLPVSPKLEPVSNERGSESNSPLTSIALEVSQFDHWVYDTSTPYVLFQDEGAPMLCLSSRTWPFPKPIGAAKPKYSIFMPSRILPAPNFSLPRGCMHKSALVIPHIINSQEYFKFKVGTIQWINDRLDTLSVGTSDATIGSILLLINFELMRGNVVEAHYHMEGIQQIVNLRGGLGNVNDRNVLTRILVIDLLVAALCAKEPRFSQPTLLPGNLLGPLLYKVPDSPLTTGRTLKIALQSSPFGEKGINYLQRAQIATMLHISGVGPSYFREDPEGHVDQNTTLSLFGIIKRASEIYLGALQTPPIPFSSVKNRNSTIALCRAVESPANDDVWDQFPGIFIWVLLVGCAAAEQGSTEYNYFMCLLIKIALGSGYGWFESFTEAVKTFVRVKLRVERWEEKICKRGDL